MKKLLLSLVGCYTLMAVAQPTVYTTANAHSHNDYEKPVPFRAAYNEGFGSVEADLHLINDTLWVAHDSATPGVSPSFEQLYLQPLNQEVNLHKGFPYVDHNKSLQLLIDLKTDGVPTLAKVVAVLQRYPALTNCTQIRFVISGSRPDPAAWNQYPAFIWFDGNLGESYTPATLSKIALLSASFTKHSTWNGKGRLIAKEQDSLQKLIAGAHALGKPVRFWASPDNTNAWYQLMKLKVDYLNTDRTRELGAFLKKLQKNSYRNDKA
ncbi:alkaline phosphatase [Paraflavitalea soli]|uniref:Alkaline phosphatase n=1 Tax=Paraflavitalea soli TaxID=2315862 RepID=A0A3B7MXU5_9BACT|nr:phosphatidylinositol-specific phospholipase C/glycerophosphodiester phosphodiesterase family protein [Paraflavitalea soli]AXY77900.1 alkaline phosphatase [Paraflavitalea soli]